MRYSLLLAICAAGLLAGRASAQQPGYFPQTSVNIVDVGGNYRLVANSPYYRPASSVPRYYSPGYSPAYQRYLVYPNFGPGNTPYTAQVYYGQQVYYTPQAYSTPPAYFTPQVYYVPAGYFRPYR
jgi:hypothetical protein